MHGEERGTDEAHESIGPYRLLDRLGEGGMGEVWLAEQSAPVRRRVALKVIKAGMDSKQVIARFEAERQALALMDHPAIARVFDAGTTARGLPYFAMEYVRGERITSFCDDQRLTNEARLRLFIDVCLGVQHAHHKGIIHRDLKPENVLVTLQDGRPAPKIIDFGLVKAITQPLTERTLFTQHGALMGTPDYMSPEQAESSGLDVDTRTDIYSLGVMLYELLSGVLPFDAHEARIGGLEELRRWIREVEPPPPSLRVQRSGKASAESAQRRRTVPSQMASELRGELDWIVMKAIDKDRARRYASPSELATDIERYLADEPVTARPPSNAYRARKFVQRHTLGFGVALAAVLGLAAFAVTMALQARRIATQAERIALERDRAERVSAFLKGLFRAANPVNAQGQALTARALLDGGAERALHELGEDPLIRADILTAIGGAYRVLGLCGDARRLLEPAVELRERELGAADPLTLDSRLELGWAQWCEEYRTNAEATFRQVLEYRGKGLDRENEISALHNLGTLLGSEELLEEARTLSEERLGAEDELTLAILADLSNVVAARDAALAVLLVEELLPRVRARVGDESPLYVVTLANLAWDLLEAGDPARAALVGEDALVRARRVLGEAAPVTLNLALNTAMAYQARERWADAEPLLRTALETVDRTRGANDVLALVALDRLGTGCMRQLRYAEGERIRLDALARQRRAGGETHPELPATLYNLACATALQGKHDDALNWLIQSVEHGFADAGWMAKDPDLTSLHGDPEFAAVIEGARERSAGAPGK